MRAPGLSGSSFGSVIRKLGELGVPDDRIILFPSRSTAGDDLISAQARRCWPRHRKYLVSFEDLWIQSGRLAQSLPGDCLVDLAAGRWRSLFFGDESQYPAVQPWHERRKYLCRRQGVKGPELSGWQGLSNASLRVVGPQPQVPPVCSDAVRRYPEYALAGTLPTTAFGLEAATRDRGLCRSFAYPLGDPAPCWMLKFAGLGRCGRDACARAQRLAQAGFHPPVHGLLHGFLVMDFVRGQPLTPPHANAAFLDHAASYLAYLRRLPATGTPMTPDELRQMIEVNVTEGLGSSWAHKLASAHCPGPLESTSTGATDGRMMLHEWLHTDSGYLKTDALDYQADHFSPGCQDSAWDLAACLVEWSLDRPGQNHLLGQYRAVTHDRTLPQRLPFYTIAYLAHRLSYATQAAQTLGPQSPDGRRFQALAARYRPLLQQALSQL